MSRVIIYDTILEEKAFNDFEKIHSFSQLSERLKSNPRFFRIAYRGIDDNLDINTDFDYCCKAVWCLRDVHFAVEEIGHLSNSWKMPVSLQTIVSAGRHKGIHFYCTSQRASNINPLIRALSTSIVTFKQTEPRDIEWLEAVMGDDAQRVSQLGLHEKMEWSDYAHSSNTPVAEPETQE